MKTNYTNWTNKLDGATKNWQVNRMYYGATNDKIKIVHVNDGSKLCSIEVTSDCKNEEIKQLFKETFGVNVINDSISYRG